MLDHKHKHVQCHHCTHDCWSCRTEYCCKCGVSRDKEVFNPFDVKPAPMPWNPTTPYWGDDPKYLVTSDNTAAKYIKEHVKMQVTAGTEHNHGH